MIKTLRDTDADWNRIGSEEPFYGVLVDDRFLLRNLDDAALAEFWNSGTEGVAHLMKTIRHQLGEFNPRTAIDFGCGVGRVARAMARHCQRVIGVDVSEGMLAKAREFATPNMELLQQIPDETVDWVHSTMVFQHIPPARGYVLFDQLLARLNPGGVFSIHLTIFKDERYLEYVTRHFSRATWDGEALRLIQYRDPPEGTMLMYDYDLTRLVMAAVAQGVSEYYFNHSDHGGCHGVTLYGRRPRTG